MARIVRGALIQTKLCSDSSDIQVIKRAMIDRAVAQIEQAASKGAQVACLQELFYGPYFCAEQNRKWYDITERIPDGPTTRLMQDLAERHGLVVVAPIYEEDLTGVYYNTAAVIDADGKFLGKFRKMHLPHCEPGFWEKFYFRPGNLGYPVFETRVGKVGVYICYDRHFPEGATVAGLSEYLWKLEQTAAAANNIYFVGAINRPGSEAPWNIGEFYGQSYFANPRGQVLAEGKRTEDDVVVADLDLELIREVRNVWQFYRDRRPDSYSSLVNP